MKILNKSILAAAVALSLSISLPVVAEEVAEGAYLSISGGFHKPKNWSHEQPKMKAGYQLRGAIGHKFCDWRAEFEPGYLHNRGSSINYEVQGTPFQAIAKLSKLELVSTLGNIYYDFPIEQNFKPYVGAGMGWGHLNIEKTLHVEGPGVTTDKVTSVQNESKPVYQAMVGVKIPMDDNIAANLEYRYLASSKFFVKRDQQERFQSHLLNVGVSYSF